MRNISQASTVQKEDVQVRIVGCAAAGVPQCLARIPLARWVHVGREHGTYVRASPTAACVSATPERTRSDGIAHVALDEPTDAVAADEHVQWARIELPIWRKQNNRSSREYEFGPDRPADIDVTRDGVSSETGFA